jgi:hypothetical protein
MVAVAVAAPAGAIVVVVALDDIISKGIIT